MESNKDNYEKTLLHSLALLTVSGLSIILQASQKAVVVLESIWSTEFWGCSALWADSLPCATLSLLPSARAQVALAEAEPPPTTPSSPQTSPLLSHTWAGFWASISSKN